MICAMPIREEMIRPSHPIIEGYILFLIFPISAVIMI
jgi:hypothetical protein